MGNEHTKIEALEHGLMRAWMSRESKAMRQALSPRFRLVVGGTTPVLLDRKSLVDAAGERWLLKNYRFGSDIYARQVDGIGIFAAELEMSGSIDGVDASGRWWLADSWRKSSIGRQWKLVDRQLSVADADPGFAQAVRALQLWRQ